MGPHFERPGTGIDSAPMLRHGTLLLVIFHHDPDHDDRFLDQVAAEAAMMRPGTMVLPKARGSQFELWL
jgi:hypothetical protein